ncbi:transcription termination factor MTERF15, mitochondrial [Phoenix dactylifera]|uniref:Transcription termination factor MTERF15, mitochondrial n=1 Tax=Phoenix dactylifera TaxID=42345 RepID=A0A8B7BJJ1_PHODC|nr:transcription termination factor MTERF15, mitochondrial [Phoenix dactylifera]
MSRVRTPSKPCLHQIMAIRVSSRRPLHCILSDFPRIPSHHPQKIRSFSKPTDPPRRIPTESPADRRFSQQSSLANILQRYCFPEPKLHEFIQKNRFLLNYRPSDVEKCIGILQSFGLPMNSLPSILPSCPSALELGFLRKWQTGFSKLGFPTVSSSLVQKVLEQSGRFQIEPEELRRSVQFMKNVGFSGETVSEVFEELPLSLTSNSTDISRKLDILKNVGLKRAEIDKVCCQFPGFLALSFEGRLRPLFEELRDLGFTGNEVRKTILDYPKLLLGMEVGELSRCIELLNNLKCRPAIKEKILRKGLLRAGIDVKLRVDCLCQHGLIHRDAFKVLYVEPRSIIYDLEDMEKKIEFLLHKIGLCIEYLVEFPEYLGVNLEKQVIPRYNIIDYLRSNGGLGFDVGMKHLVKLSKLKFYNFFVKPYPECEKIFGGSVREVEAKPRHPTGLWKLFKPQKFSDSKEDIRNMKQFMETLV